MIISNNNNMKKLNLNGILIIWLFLLIGFLIIVFWGSIYMRQIALSDPKVAVIRGKELFKNGQILPAIYSFEKAIQINPEDREAYFYLGKLYYLQKKYTRTLDMFYRFQQIRPTHVDWVSFREEMQTICWSIASVYVVEKKWVEAEDAYSLGAMLSCDPIASLATLKQMANQSFLKPWKNILWNGHDVFVTVENFERTSVPVFDRWVKNNTAVIKTHTLSSTLSYRGQKSELFSIEYNEQNPDLWGKVVFLPFTHPVGVRMFVYANKESVVQLVVSFRYEKTEPQAKYGPEAGGISAVIRLQPKVWTKIEANDLYQQAVATALNPVNQWSTKNMVMEVIGINTLGVNCEIFIDDIQLY
ncbi:MAG: tetratricopeptide repeat protein [bacterium]|nr:tetratricopeptide repeat protein [bacterium]